MLQNIHHLGFACADIQTSIDDYRNKFAIQSVGSIVYDAYQQAHVCLLITEHGPNIELVSGDVVSRFINQADQHYHTCYEVDNLDSCISLLCQDEGVLIKPAHPAPLFDGRRVAFIDTPQGLIELLESENAHQHDSHYTICLSGTFNIESIGLALTAQLDTIHLPLQVQTTLYGQVLQTLYDQSSLFYQSQKSINIILFRLEDFFFYQKSILHNDVEFKAKVRECIDDFLQAIDFAAKQGCQLIILFCPQTLEMNATQRDYLEQQTDSMILSFAAYSSVHCVTSLRNSPAQVSHDTIAESVGHLPYLEQMNEKIVKLICRYTHQSIRKPYKVIVVDCDDTLWAGACGEIEPQALKQTSAHHRLQQQLKLMADNGFVVCLCSKNNESDVLNVFKQCPDMPLSLDDIVTYEINWENKSTNLSKIAHRLNVSLNDFIFIDNNPLEIAEVNRLHTGILALQFPESTTKAHVFLDNLWCFDFDETAHSEQSRKTFYIESVARDQLQESVDSYQDFIDNLNLNISITSIEPKHYARVVELTQRTNQFNINPKQITLAELEKYLQTTKGSALCVIVNDRFGEYGLVGVMITTIQDTRMVIQDFILSCRTLGKGVEYQMLRELAHQAKQQHCDVIEMMFKSTERNKPAEAFCHHLPYFEKKQAESEHTFSFKVDDLLDIHYEVTPVDPAMRSYLNCVNTDRQLDNLVIKTALNTALHVNEVAQPMQTTATDLKQGLKDIWHTLLKTPVHENDDFFALGGDSILGIQLLSRIYSQTGVKLNLSLIFDYPQFNAMLQQIKVQAHSQYCPQQIESIERTDVMTKSQISFWLIDQFNNGNSWFYNLPYAIMIHGDINEDALNQSLVAIVNRHHILRAYYRLLDGDLKQLYHPPITSLLQSINLEDVSQTDFSQQLLAASNTHFDLSKDLLIRARLYYLGNHAHCLLLTIHHIVADGWSFGVIYKELSALYQSFLNQRSAHLPELNIQFSDYAAWFEKEIENKQDQLTYWKDRLHNIEPQYLPVDNQRQGPRLYQGGYCPLTDYHPDLVNALRQIAKDNSVSLFVIMFLLYATLIAKLCKKRNIVILVTVSGRHHENVENLIGCFNNNIAIRLDIDTELSFLENLHQNKPLIIQDLSYQDIPYSTVLENLSLSKQDLDSSLLQISFTMQNTKHGMLTIPGASSYLLQRHHGAARLDLTLELEEDGECLVGGFYYDTELLNQNTVETFKQDYYELCVQACKTVQDNKQQ